MEISNSQDRNFLRAEQEWDLPRLYSDLAKANYKRLSKSSKRYLEGVLLGFSPSDIARSYNYQGKNVSGTVRTILARDIYPLIKLHLNLPENHKIRWDDVPNLLSQYRNTNRINTFSSVSLDGNLLHNIYSSSVKHSKANIIKNLLDKYFQRNGFTEDFLSHNIKEMSFRQEWQYIVEKLVGETREYLRAMVLDTELQKWWSSVAGITYMATNVDLLKRGVKIKRIFIMNSIDFRIRSNALMSAYIHDKIGVDVKILDNMECQLKLYLDADMLSVHDKDFIVLYYLDPKKETTQISLDGCSASSFASFYDELFYDRIVCKDINEVISHDNLSKSFFSQIEQEVSYLYKYSCTNSVKDLLKILPN